MAVVAVEHKHSQRSSEDMVKEMRNVSSVMSSSREKAEVSAAFRNEILTHRELMLERTVLLFRAC